MERGPALAASSRLQDMEVLVPRVASPAPTGLSRAVTHVTGDVEEKALVPPSAVPSALSEGSI